MTSEPLETGARRLRIARPSSFPRGISLLAAVASGLMFAVSTSPVVAHPGGLAADGCHNDRKNGGRHCHRGQASTQPRQPARRGNVYYANCDAVRAAGADPIYRGEPGYASHLDRDNDGIACEKRR